MSWSYDSRGLVADLLRRAQRLIDAGQYARALPLVDRALAQLRVSGDSTPGRRVQFIQALSARAWILDLLARDELAIAAFDELIETTGHDAGDALKSTLAWAMSRKAFSLARLDRADEATMVWRELMRGFAEDADRAVSDLVAVAWMNLSLALAMSTSMERLVVALAAEDDPVELAVVGRSLVVDADGLVDRTHAGEALELVDAVLDRTANRSERLLRHTYALALITKVGALASLGDGDSAASAFQELIDRFGTEALEVFDAEIVVRNDERDLFASRRLAAALFAKANILAELERNSEARAARDELERRFATNPDPRIKLVLQQARELAIQPVQPPQTNPPRASQSTTVPASLTWTREAPKPPRKSP